MNFKTPLRRSLACRLIPLGILLWVTGCSAAIVDRTGHGPEERFVEANGVRLQYLDWGGHARRTLIFVHGLGDNPHVFDDLAPALADRYHILAYARRGHGLSEAKGPYDIVTLTSDLRGLMDVLGIARANLVGWSMGGSEITAMAARFPQRVGKLVYLDSYDLSDPGYEVAMNALPRTLMDAPEAATASMSDFLEHERAVDYPAVADFGRVEAYLRGLVKVLPDGRVTWRTPKEVREALFQMMRIDQRDYLAVHRPALAIFAQSVFDPHATDEQRRSEALEWERSYWQPFRSNAIYRMQRDLGGLRVETVPGSHRNFFVVSRESVLAAMRQFLGEDAR